MDLHIVMITVYFLVFWICLDSTSVAQEISIESTDSTDPFSASSQTTAGPDALSGSSDLSLSTAINGSDTDAVTSESPSTKSTIKVVNFAHDGNETQEFTAYANFPNGTDVSFVARHPSDRCLEADARINKVVLYFGDLDCNTTMMWGKSGFFWGRGDSEMMSHISSDSKDVRVSLSNRNIYLVGEDKNKATEIFVCDANETLTSVEFLFEKGAHKILPKGCEMTLLLDNEGFLDQDDITALNITLPTTTTVPTTTLPSTTSVITSEHSGGSTNRKTRTIATGTTASSTTTVATRKTRPTPMKSTEATTVMTTPKTTVITSTEAINATQNSTPNAQNSTPNARIPTKKAPIIPVIRVEPTTDNGAGEYRPWAVINIGLLLLIIALY